MLIENWECLEIQSDYTEKKVFCAFPFVIGLDQKVFDLVMCLTATPR
jgi:hypothetical protein